LTGSNLSDYLDDFGRSLGGLISVLDPDAVVLGGGLSNIGELYSDGRERVKKYAFHDKLHTPILKNQPCRFCRSIWCGVDRTSRNGRERLQQSIREKR